MKSQGNELRERSKSWNPRKRLEAYRLIKLFNQAGFRLYIVTMVQPTAHDGSQLLIKSAEKIGISQTTASSIYFLGEYHLSYRYDIESAR